MTSVEVKSSGGGSGLNVYGAVLIIAVMVAFYIFYKKSKDAEILANDLRGNVEALKGEVLTYEVKLNDSTKVHVSKVQQLSIEISDWKRMYNQEYNTVKKLGKRLSEVNVVGNLASITADTIYVPVYVDSMKQITLDYKSQWIDISAKIPKSGKAELSYSKRDSLIIINTIERKRILWGLIKYGHKNSRWQASSMDPNTKISGLSVKHIIN